MGKKKYKEKNEDEKFIHDAIGQKWISVFSLSAFSVLGIWMILSPDGGEHSSVEKSTVYLVKEIWSLEAGVIILALCIPFIIRTFIKIKTMKGFTWVKFSNGYNLYDYQTRISGLESLYDGNDLVVFNPNKNEVYNFTNYLKSKLNKYYKVTFDQRFNCNDAYWTAAEDGFYIFYKGKRTSNLTSEYRGDDLIVTAGDLGKKFKLKDYKSNLDNRIRKADRY